MDFNVMKQIKKPSVNFRSSPGLTSYPLGMSKTPGFGAKSLFSLYTPEHSREVNVIKKETPNSEQTIIDKSEQGGSGQSAVKQIKDESAAILEKMNHPTFRVKNFDPNKIKEEEKIREGQPPAKKPRKVAKF
jgi:hypothetical protein